MKRVAELFGRARGGKERKRGRERGGRLVVNAMPVIWVARSELVHVMGFHVGENLWKVAQADKLPLRIGGLTDSSPISPTLA